MLFPKINKECENSYQNAKIGILNDLYFINMMYFEILKT